MQNTMSTGIYLTTIGLFFGTILIVFAMKYISVAVSARARIASDEAYKALADKAVALESQSAAALAAIQADVAKLKVTVTSVEEILRKVG